jgi:Flp pilus assembly protein TadD
MFRPRTLVVACFAFLLSAASLYAGDLRIPLPKKSKYTPVQALNRDGVKAVEKHQYERAKKLFYKAYLIDPNDPFTLNNLGYMAELDGDADRARRFYALSAEMGSDAIIDKSNDEAMQGKPVSSVAGQAEDKGIKLNRLNNQAIALLEKDRAPEADLILQKALTIDPSNPFTLNNLGYAKEKEGELEAAYQFYTAAADRDSQAKVEVALNKDWRGRGISDVARDNARSLNKRLRKNDDLESRVAILNLRGVSALNRNDRSTGRDFIQKAFKLDPSDAFTLNNMGYLAELDGDKETADFYYERAREANQKNTKIALATNKDVEGKKIGDVADVTDQLVEQQMAATEEARRRAGGPVVLLRRNNTAVMEPPKPVHEVPKERVSDANGDLLLPPLPGATASPAPVTSQPANQPSSQPGGLMQPLPDNEQPTTVKEGPDNGGLLMPLPDNEQPTVQPNGAQPQPKEGPHNGGMIMPLPDDQQPGTKPNSAQPAPQPKTSPDNGGLMMPLPDNEQPAAAQPSQPVAAPNSTTSQPVQPVVPPASMPSSQPDRPVVPPSTPTTSQPVQPGTSNQPPVAAPAQPQSSQPPLLLPPPDNQPPQAQPNTTSSQPKHISDEDQKPQGKKNNAQSDGAAPKKISDQ